MRGLHLDWKLGVSSGQTSSLACCHRPCASNCHWMLPLYLSPILRSAYTAAIVLCVGACTTPRERARDSTAPVPSAEVSERLYFGQSIPGGSTVSAEEWSTFLREVITVRFPQGLTVWRAEGQWLERTGVLAKEPVVVVEIIHRTGLEVDSALNFIVAEYKRRFRQEAVLRVTSPVRMRVYGE